MMKKTQRMATEVRAEIIEQAKVIAYEQNATLGSRALAAHIDYMRKLLKELAACKEE